MLPLLLLLLLLLLFGIKHDDHKKCAPSSIRVIPGASAPTSSGTNYKLLGFSGVQCFQ